MKQFLVLSLALAGLSLATTSCSDNKGPTETRTTTEKTAPATAEPLKPLRGFCCSVHPQVTSDKPGTCPTCGRALVAQN